MPAFFLPQCSPESEEGVYAHIAESCVRKVPPIGSRIYIRSSSNTTVALHLNRFFRTFGAGLSCA